MKKQTAADLVMVLVTAMWGLASIVASIALKQIAPMQLNAFRFGIAFIFSYAVLYKKMKGITKETVRASIILGIILAGVYAASTYAIAYTKVTKLGFIFALTSVLVPLINFVFRKIKIDLKTGICIICSVIGLAMLTLQGASVSIEGGDFLAIAGALIYAVDVVAAEILIKNSKVDALQMGVLHIGAAAVVLTAAAFAAGEKTVVPSMSSAACILFLAVLATAFPFIAQPIAQQYTTSNHVGLIISLEPVFTAAGAYVIIDERLSPAAYIGGFIMLVSVAMINVQLPSKERKHERS